MFWHVRRLKKKSLLKVCLLETKVRLLETKTQLLEPQYNEVLAVAWIWGSDYTGIMNPELPACFYHRRKTRVFGKNAESNTVFFLW